MQSDAVHHLVHDECRPRHVTRIFKQGNEQIEDHNVRQEHQDAPHAANDTVDDEVFQHAVGHIS